MVSRTVQLRQTRGCKIRVDATTQSKVYSGLRMSGRPKTVVMVNLKLLPQHTLITITSYLSRVNAHREYVKTHLTKFAKISFNLGVCEELDRAMEAFNE